MLAGGTNLSFAVQQLGGHVVAGEPLLALHHDRARRFVRMAEIRRPHRHKATAIDLQRSVELEHGFVGADLANQRPASDLYFL